MANDDQLRDLIEMLEMRLNPLVAEVAERYNLSVCSAIKALHLGLREVHIRAHKAALAGDAQWN